MSAFYAIVESYGLTAGPHGFTAGPQGVCRVGDFDQVERRPVEWMMIGFVFLEFDLHPAQGLTWGRTGQVVGVEVVHEGLGGDVVYRPKGGEQGAGSGRGGLVNYGPARYWSLCFLLAKITKS